MTTIKHSLDFEADILETSEMGKILLKLDTQDQVKILTKILKDTLTPELTNILEDLNANSSWAVLKVAN